MFGAIGDPVGAGYVASLPRPGGNVTGVSHLSPDIAAKGLELLKELMPSTRLIVVLFPVSPNPSSLSMLVKKYARALKGTGKQIGIHAHNNQQLAFANTIQSIIDGVCWPTQGR